MWQFSAQANCGIRRCPYRVAGTTKDIDVNVAPMDAAALRKAWPFGQLIETNDEFMANVPVPIAREHGLRGESRITYASVTYPVHLHGLADALRSSWNRALLGALPPITAPQNRYADGMAEYAAARFDERLREDGRANLDPFPTASTGLDRSEP